MKSKRKLKLKETKLKRKENLGKKIEEEKKTVR